MGRKIKPKKSTNKAAQEVRTPKFRLRIVKSKKSYSRKKGGKNGPA